MAAHGTTFGLIIDWPDTTNSYQKSIIRGISSYAARNDVNIITFAVGRLGSEYSWEKSREFLFDFTCNRELFSGFLAFSSSLSIFSGTDMLVRKFGYMNGIPVVSIALDIPGMHSILIDNKPGFRELLEHMIVYHGYTNIAFISGPKQNDEAQERLEMVKTALKSHDMSLPESHLYFGNFGMTAGAAAVRYFLDEKKIRPDAIIAANDNMAMGAWQELANRRIVVPRDMALTGFDDLLISDTFDLPFTTVRQPLFMQGYEAAETLHHIVSGHEVPRVTLLPSKLVFRSSCGCNTPELLNLEKKTCPEAGSAHDFMKRSSKKFLKAVKQASAGYKGDPMNRAWNSIVLEAVEISIRQSEMFELVTIIIEKVKSGVFSNEEREMVLSESIRMKSMVTDFFIQSDLLERVLLQNASLNVINQIESFGSNPEDFHDLKEQMEDLPSVFGSTKTRDGYVVIFDKFAYREDGKSTLLLHFKNGTLLKTGDRDVSFDTRELLPCSLFPSERFELVVEALCDGSDQYGLLITSMDAEGINVFEMLRLKVSAVIRDYLSRTNLLSLNRRLQNEIDVRQRTEHQLQNALEALKGLSLTDELTGLYNRRGFLTLGEQQLRYCKREGEPFQVFFIDMDGLKIINDKYGHTEGDFALQTAASILQHSFRETDIVARIGGDEFTVFAAKAQTDNIDIMLNRIASLVKETNATLDKPYTISMSTGVYSSTMENPEADDSGTSLSAMLSLADQELYRKKREKKKLARQ